jgi:hypothetical protein
MAAAVTKIGLGTKAWYQSKKKRAKYLITQMDEGYVELGFILHELFDTPKNNDPKQLGAYEAWSGHSHFGVFCEEELGLHRRKGNKLRNVGRCLEVKLAAIPQPVKRKLVKLGWTKLNELVRIFEHIQDLKTVTKWAEAATELSYPELMKSVQATLDKMGVQNGVMVEDVTQGDEDVDEDDEYAEPAGGGKQTVEQAAKALPQPTRTKLFNFLCIDEQVDNVFEALARAKELAKKQTDSNIAKSGLLSLICLDFLATNDFGKKNDPKTVKKYLKRLEIALGVKLIAVQGKDGILYGQSTVKKLMAAIAETED